MSRSEQRLKPLEDEAKGRKEPRAITNEMNIMYLGTWTVTEFALKKDVEPGF